MSDFKYEFLGSGIYVAVSKEHTFGTDAVLLADFASPKRNERACDLGTSNCRRKAICKPVNLFAKARSEKRLSR